MAFVKSCYVHKSLPS